MYSGFIPRFISHSILGLTLAVCFTSCSTMGSSKQAQAWELSLGPVPARQVTPEQLTGEVQVRKSLLKAGARNGRRYKRPMTAKYITIHSTQNYTGDAWAHSKALHNGALRGGRTGYLVWHFTVQDDVVIQHMPTNEEGEHADFDGPGNRQSIGIEMCEHRGNDIAKTIDRTARLAASLMYYHNVPLENVVPHYHWPRKGYNPAHKNCPHFLLEDGKPGATWNWFLSRVKRHHARISLNPKPEPQQVKADVPAEDVVPAELTASAEETASS